MNWVKRLTEQSAIECIRERKKEILADNPTIEKLAQRYADLELDFEYVKNINTQVAERFEAVVGRVPTSEEFKIGFDKTKLELEKDGSVPALERLAKLQFFLEALEFLEKNEQLKTPPKYEEPEPVEFTDEEEQEANRKMAEEIEDEEGVN